MNVVKKLLCLLICIPALAHAQKNGVRFEQSLSWIQLKAKAKAENKYIFVDCYATWCGPCKRMDKEIYPIDSVGNLVNEKFISVKMQFDTSKQDDEMVKSHYSEAKEMMQEYKITTFPSYLFFTPGGKIVHRGVGEMNSKDFISLINRALDSTRQYYPLLEQYQKGERNYAAMVDLAFFARNMLNDNELAKSIGQDYLQNYLYKLNDGNLYEKENITVMSTYILSTNEKGFDFFYKHSDKVDSLIRPGFSRAMVDYLITKEIDEKLYKNNKPLPLKPDWKKLSNIISKKYNDACAERIILNSEIRWYGINKDWKEWGKYKVVDVQRNGPGWIGYNGQAWDIFLHCNSKNILKVATNWMKKKVLQTRDSLNSAYMDTYANLLYKIGHSNQAIGIEQKAIIIEKKNSITSKQFILLNKEEKTLEKMKRGDPTWPIQ